MYGIVIDQRSLVVHLFAILSFKRGKNAERPIMTKTVIIRYRNHESNMKTLIGYLYVHPSIIQKKDNKITSPVICFQCFPAALKQMY